MAELVRINVTPVKGLSLHHPDTAELSERGIEANRRYYLSSGGRLYNGKDHGPLVAVVAHASDDGLSLSFPGGAEVSGEIVLGAPVVTDFWGRPVSGRVVEGPWARALSDYSGDEVTLVQTDLPGTAVDIAVGTIVGHASCDRLAEELGAAVDPRRFRMLFELDGLEAHEEDGWRGRAFGLGEAILRVGGPVPRCMVTTQDPESGAVTLDTLRGIKRYRGLREGRFIDFGVYFDVERAGRVCVGDRLVELEARVPVAHAPGG